MRFAAVATAALVTLTGTLQAQQIASRPLTPREITIYALPEGTMTSGGLMVVGIGESVYLEAQVPKDTVVNGVSWSILDRPLGGSVADFLETPIVDEMPIYSVGDREVFDVAGRTNFIPDLEGKYIIQATVTTDGDPIVMETQVTGAMYVGIGTLGAPEPVYPQCALCHEEQALDFMGTGHAGAFEQQIEGMGSSHFNPGCISCHALGKGEGDVSGSFFEVALDVGWTFPETLEAGNWDAMPLELQEMASVQCEHCHGAGSIHHGDITTTAVSLSSGDCGQCHDAEPYHVINQEWDLSRHAVATRYPTGPNRGSCVECHSGIAFIEEMDGIDDKRTDYEAIVCAACHDPHSAENPHQVRTIADVTLNNDEVVAMGGTGKLCMNCHKGRRNGPEYVEGNVSRHFGPHYGVQGDMFSGTNAIEYDGKVKGGPSAHMYAIENSCAGCHMQGVGSDEPGYLESGGHTFKMAWDAGTPDDHSDDVDRVGACVDCHGPVDSFDMERVDYNFDGTLEGLQTEVHHLLEALAMHLPPIGEPTMAIDADYPYTLKEKQALFNYLCVEEDGSFGMHNPRYITALLTASIEDLADPFNAVFNGRNIPVGGEWFYSNWFDFYAPGDQEGMIYHFEHGHLFVVPGADGVIWLYELRTNQWRFTTADTYPLMYSPEDGQWFYYAGRNVNNERMFYDFANGQWVVIF
jgi:hypothetical protein